MIRTYLRDLVNDHKPAAELNNIIIIIIINNNNNNNNRAEWKIQLTMQNSWVSTKVLKKLALYTQKVNH